MKNILQFGFPIVVGFAILILLVGCVQKNYPSGNPSEILDTKTYNRVQKKYSSVKHFQLGTAIVSYNDKYGLIDEKGNEVLSCIYDSITSLKKDSYRIIISEDKYGVVDVDGSIICVGYDGAYICGKKYIALKMNDKWGFVDNKHKVVIQFKYEKLYEANDSVFVAQYDGLYGVARYDGSVVIPFLYEEPIDSVQEQDVKLSYEEFVVGERYSVCKRKSKMKKIFETDDTFCSEGVDIIHFRDTIVSIIVHFDNDNVFKKNISDLQVKYGVKEPSKEYTQRKVSNTQGYPYTRICTTTTYNWLLLEVGIEVIQRECLHCEHMPYSNIREIRYYNKKLRDEYFKYLDENNRKTDDEIFAKYFYYNGPYFEVNFE